MSKIKLTPPAPDVSLSSKISDVVKTTTCYMCACRCGIKVHLSDGKIRYIEGNPDHPVNGGVLCAKGSAGIMHQNSPGKLTKPLKRVGERGKGEFVEIEWDEALDIATDWLGTVKNSDPKKLAFFTGRDQSQSFTGWWAAKFGTPNYAAHGGFCSVNMAAAGLYSIGGSFWEFGEPDFENTKLFIMFGVAEDHDSNPIKIGLGKLKNRENTKFISVNPIRTGYSSIADEWIAIKPGTDGLFVSSIINYILKENKFDSEFLIKNTNSAWLVIDNPGTDEDGLFFRDKDGNPVCFDENTNGVVSVKEKKIKPQLEKELITENGLKLRTAFCKFKERFNSSDLNPENVAKEIGLSAETITRISEEIIEAAYNTESNIKQKWTDVDGVVHSEFKGRAVSFHAMRGISAHTNGFHTCRIIHTLQMLSGAIDGPGGGRYIARFPIAGAG
ncbi:MAG: molybdopterin-dependent oxidoreductase, partial [Hyphomicrobiales bacterium]